MAPFSLPTWRGPSALPRGHDCLIARGCGRRGGYAAFDSRPMLRMGDGVGKYDISRFRSGIMDALCVRRPGIAVLHHIESLGGIVMVLDGHRRCGSSLSRRPLLEVGALIIPLPLPVRGSLRLGWPEGGGLGLGRTFDIFDAFYSTCRRGRRTHDCFCEWCQEGCVVHLPLWVDSPASRVPPSDIEAATVAAALEQLSLEGSTEAAIYGSIFGSA